MNAARLALLALVVMVAAGAQADAGRDLQQALPPLPVIPAGCKITSANVTKALPTCKLVDILANINTITSVQQLLTYCKLPDLPAIQTAIAGCDVQALGKAISDYLLAILKLLLSLFNAPSTAAAPAPPTVGNGALLKVIKPIIAQALPELQNLNVQQIIAKLQEVLAAAGVTIPPING